MIEYMTLKQARKESVKRAKQLNDDFYYEIFLLTDGITTDFIFTTRSYIRSEVLAAETFRTYSNKYEAKEIRAYKRLLSGDYEVIECKRE